MKVLIADDELHIRNGLRNGIAWEELGITKILTAEDGEMALRLCEEERPEFLITDIRMPGLDGLDLAQQASERWGIRKIVIFSGYSEFEYAKKAISIGVVEYLLKPVNMDELFSLLKKSAEEIRQEDQAKMENLQKMLRVYLEEDGLTGNAGENEKRNISRILGELYEGTSHIPTEMVLLIIEEDNIYGRKKGQNISAHLEMNQKVLWKTEQRMVLLHAINSRKERQEYRHQLKKQLMCWNENQKCATFSMGISERGDDRCLLQLYRQAANCLKHRMYSGEKSCLFYEDIRWEKELAHPLLYLEKEQIERTVNIMDMSQLKIQIHKQFEYLYSKRCTEKQVAQELCLAIKNIVFNVMKEKGIDIEGVLDRNEDLFRKQMDFSSLDSYEAWICDYCSLLLQSLSDLHGKHYSSVISRAVDYINQHYSEEVTLKMVADEVNKSSSYFSCIFKKEMNVNFNEYLNQVRIRKAKELLRMPDAIIYEVAEQTGFHDYKYFTKVFKKLCGCSPTEYIKNENR